MRSYSDSVVLPTNMRQAALLKRLLSEEIEHAMYGHLRT
jgi:hypothetical protein